MGRFLPFIIIGVLAYFFLLRPRLRPPPAPPGQSAATGQQPRSGSGEDMVRCSQCGVHLPRSEGILSQGRIFCSEEHRLKFRA